MEGFQIFIIFVDVKESLLRSKVCGRDEKQIGDRCAIPAGSGA